MNEEITSRTQTYIFLILQLFSNHLCYCRIYCFDPWKLLNESLGYDGMGGVISLSHMKYSNLTQLHNYKGQWLNPCTNRRTCGYRASEWTTCTVDHPAAIHHCLCSLLMDELKAEVKFLYMHAWTIKESTNQIKVVFMPCRCSWDEMWIPQMWHCHLFSFFKQGVMKLNRFQTNALDLNNALCD